MSEKFIVDPSDFATNTVIRVPGDKSISHRALMLAAIAEGETQIHHFLSGEDCLSTLHALQALGVSIIGPDSNDNVRVKGVGKRGFKTPEFPLDMGNSGTSMRLLAGLLAGQGIEAILVGDPSLMSRPMRRVVEPLKQMGAKIDCAETGCPPIVIGKSLASLKGLEFESAIPSAQLKSALLLAGIYAEGETTLIEPIPTRDHTERMLKAFGYPLVQYEKTIRLNSQGYLIGTEIHVPGDMSSATFFLVSAAMTPDAELCINGVGINPGRVGVIAILREMGAEIYLDNQRFFNHEPVADLRVIGHPLQGIEIPAKYIASAIDEFPAIFIAAATASGRTILRGASELRVKESDRIMVMAKGLTTLGIHNEILADGIVIEGGVLGGGLVDSLGDHRIAMAFAIAGFMASAPIVIDNCQPVATSFPSFKEVALTCGLAIKHQC